MVEDGYTEYTDAELKRVIKLVDPVNREKLIKDLGYDANSYTQGFYAGVRTVLKHAHWIECCDGDGDYRECSYCGESLPRYDVPQGRESIEQTPYCPYCGMIMDEKVSE